MEEGNVWGAWYPKSSGSKDSQLDSTGTPVKGSGWGDLSPCRLLVGKSAEFLPLAVLNPGKHKPSSGYVLTFSWKPSSSPSHCVLVPGVSICLFPNSVLLTLKPEQYYVLGSRAVTTRYILCFSSAVLGGLNVNSSDSSSHQMDIVMACQSLD